MFGGGQDGSMDARQMQAIMAMAAAGMPGMGKGNAGGMPGGDDAAAQQAATMQTYMQMIQYFQQAQQSLQQPGLGMPGGLPMNFGGVPGGLGMPGMPGMGGFPGMPGLMPPAAPAEPTIVVCVEGMKFQYQMTEDDLLKVFTRYGSVKHINVNDAGSGATVTFHTMRDAQAAMQDLNGKELRGLDGTLRIEWQTPAAAPAAPYPGLPFPGAGFAAAPWTPGSPQDPYSGGAGVDGKAQGKGVRKYTCRFMIGIVNDKEFQVARRIIGAKGANMKRIVQQTEAKLRLRGVGSGYFEGPGQSESQEPLQLCISCQSAEGYSKAVHQIEELLKHVYEEYKQFCRDNGKPVPDLQINLSENQLVYSPSRGQAKKGGYDGGGPGVEGPEGGAGNQQDLRRVRRNRAGKAATSASGEVERGEPGPNAPPVDEIEKQIELRNEARRACNFAEADRIRESLLSSGVALLDEPGGRGHGSEVTTWRYWRD